MSVENVWANGLCTQCGTCSGVCPQNVIKMIRLSNGDYAPKLSANKCNACHLCVKVCPGISPEVKSVPLKSSVHSLLGSFINTLVGCAANPEIKAAGASGGVVSALLHYLLENHLVDGVIGLRMKHAGMNATHPLQPEIIIAKSKDEIVSCSQSKYLPAPVNIILKKIMQQDGRYAIVGLPCHIRGIKKATYVFPSLNEKIYLTIGLFCGFRVNFLATMFWLRKFGLSEKEVTKIQYRARSSQDWFNGGGGLLVQTKNGNEVYVPKKIFSIVDPIFIPRRCTLCDDLTNEFADISIGDPGSKFFKMSMIMTRTNLGDKTLLSSVRKGYISAKRIRSIDVTKVHYEGLTYKKVNLSSRLQVHKAFGLQTPQYHKNYFSKFDLLDYIGAFLLLINSKLCYNRFFRAFVEKIPLNMLSVYSRLVYMMVVYGMSAEAIRRFVRAIREGAARANVRMELEED